MTGIFVILGIAALAWGVVLAVRGSVLPGCALFLVVACCFSTDFWSFDAAGLSHPTKFDLGRTFELDYNDVWFAVAPGAPYGQIPKLGLLHPSLVKRARAAFSAARK